MLQKRLITVLVAVSIPVSSIITSTIAPFNSAPAWAAEVDYNAGADASGYQPPENKNSDLERSDAATAGNSTTDSGAAAGTGAANGAGTGSTSAAGTGATAAGDDGSVDSIWSETPSIETKSGKSKKKTREKSKPAPKKKDSAKSRAGADAGAGTSGDEAAANAGTSNPAPANPAANANAYTSTDAGSAAGGDSGANVNANAPSDFGSYPAVNSGAGRSVLDQPVSATIFGNSKPAKTENTITRPVTTTPQTVSTPTENSTATKSATTAPAAAPTTSPATSPTTATTTTSTATPTAGTTATTTGTATTTTSAPSATTAPLCPTRNFFQSELVRTVSWPGVGPFKGDTDPNDLADPQDNKLTLKTEGDKLSSAELFLLHQPGNPQGFINLQMVMDFMLEALGTKDKRINEFNSFLDKNKEKVIKKLATEEKPLITNSGPYQISIASSGANNESSYLVQIRSRASAGSGSETGTGTAGTSEPLGTVAMTNSGTNNGTNSGGNQSRTTPPRNGGNGTAGTTTIGTTTTGTTVAAGSITKTGTPVKRTPPKAVPEDVSSAPVATNDSLKQEFVDTIRGWQAIKKVAVRNCDPSELSKILTGKALDKQTVAIGWLVKKKDYYELTPKGVVVDRYEEVSQAPKRYAVFAQVKEFSRLMDQTNNKMLSESDDSYKVKYTIERTGDHWSIYDSDLIKTTATAVPAGDSKTANKPKR